MKKLIKLSAYAFLFTSLLVGCSSDGTAEDVLSTDPDDVLIDPDTGVVIEPAIIRLTEGGDPTDIFFAEATGEAGETVEGRVIFTTTTDAQKRLYVTQTLPDGTTEPFVIEELSNRGTKADGSIDLDGDNTDALDFTFTLNVPDNLEDGSFVYNFWSTSGLSLIHI